MVAFVSALGVSADRVTVVGPSWALVVFTAFGFVALACGIVTAMKGRWGWLVLGLMSAGLLWIVGALQPPAPASVWQRWCSARATRHNA